MEPSYKITGLFVKKDNFYFDRIKFGNEVSEEDYALVLCDNDIAKYQEYINNKNITRLIIDVKASKVENVDFLRSMPNIKHLWVNGDIDIDYLYQHEELKQLVLGRYSGRISIDKIRGLEYFFTGLPENVDGWENADALKTLSINGYASNKPKIRKIFSNFELLKHMSKLDSLMVSNMSIKSLNGIENLKQLTVLRLEQNSTLSDITALVHVKDSLKHLRIEWCPRIDDFDVLHNLKELNFLSLEKNRNIKRLDLLQLHQLSGLRIIDCQIMDGNLTGVSNLNFVPIIPIRRNFYVVNNGDKIPLKDNMLPYGDFDMGDETIERWRKWCL